MGGIGKSNPALEWLTDVQRNAEDIVAAAEQATVDALEASAPSWDLSSVVETSPVFPDEMEGDNPNINTPPTNALEPPTIPNPETDAAATPAPGLTDAPKAPTTLPTEEELETALRGQISPEQFERALSTLERYGPEEGLRRLKESTPEVANQIEHRRSGEEGSQ